MNKWGPAFVHTEDWLGALVTWRPLPATGKGAEIQRGNSVLEKVLFLGWKQMTPAPVERCVHSLTGRRSAPLALLPCPGAMSPGQSRRESRWLRGPRGATASAISLLSNVTLVSGRRGIKEKNRKKNLLGNNLPVTSVFKLESTHLNYKCF